MAQVRGIGRRGQRTCRIRWPADGGNEELARGHGGAAFADTPEEDAAESDEGDDGREYGFRQHEAGLSGWCDGQRGGLGPLTHSTFDAGREARRGSGRRVWEGAGVFEEGGEAEVVSVALDFDLGHGDGGGDAFEGGDGVRAHDLRGDEEVDAVDVSAGEQGGVEAGAGFGEEGEDVFLAELVEDFAEGTRPASAGRISTRMPRMRSSLMRAWLLETVKTVTSFWAVLTSLQSRGMRRAESRTMRWRGRRRGRPLRSVSRGRRRGRCRRRPGRRLPASGGAGRRRGLLRW